ncbi:hypothetical protein E1A91_D11G109500v1 [Gossypium mustelinum]|uniref:Uncharacterized protein n=1 Tax=Gossypium mustelinum TaxID=34275 RepID=A0A5D2SQK5_GOSMU|nr:hypothetical protein E1A91_D11G109500v1 [Gossypium mustelinum]
MIFFYLLLLHPPPSKKNIYIFASLSYSWKCCYRLYHYMERILVLYCNSTVKPNYRNFKNQNPKRCNVRLTSSSNPQKDLQLQHLQHNTTQHPTKSPQNSIPANQFSPIYSPNSNTKRAQIQHRRVNLKQTVKANKLILKTKTKKPKLNHSRPQKEKRIKEIGIKD